MSGEDAGRRARHDAPSDSIFVLRNNDIGDLLVVTPLFEALRRARPHARIVAGVGAWALPVLRHNPWIDESIGVSAPWFNKYTRGGLPARLRYLLGTEVRSLQKRRFSIGIDILGSTWGAILLQRASIPLRLGTSGYAGGEWGFQRSVPFDPHQRVGQAALRFATLLGATTLPEARPQVFLDQAERDRASEVWGPRRVGVARLIVAPGAGIDQRAWPEAHWLELASKLADQDVQIIWLGGTRASEARTLGALRARLPSAMVVSPPLREVFALLEAADIVVCNSSMVLHAAAAFARPTLVLLGPAFRSAGEHDLAWGHPRAITLGPSPDHPGIATAEAALGTLRELVSNLSRPRRSDN